MVLAGCLVTLESLEHPVVIGMTIADCKWG